MHACGAALRNVACARVPHLASCMRVAGAWFDSAGVLHKELLLADLDKLLSQFDSKKAA